MMDEQFGCVIFDDVHQHKNGWAAKSTDKKSFHISGINELESKVVWLTNLDYNASFIAGLNNHGRFRRADYLRHNTFRIGSHLNIEDDLRQQALCYSKLFERVSRLSNCFFNINEVHKDRLAKAFRTHSGVYDPIYSSYFAEYFESATSHYVLTEQQFKENKENISIADLWIPALTHCKNIVATPLPVGKWKKVKRNKLPSYPQIMQWLMELSGPGIVKVNVTDIDPLLSPLFNFGSGSQGNLRRKWITTTELMSLVPIANIDILEAHISEGLVVLDALNDIVQVIPEEAVLSLSCHFMLDSLWTGLTALNPPPSARGQKKTNSGYKSYNPVTPFLKAYDRFHCMSYVLQLSKMGFNVRGYGTGKITIDTTDLTERDVYTACKELGLIPPVMNVPDLDTIAFNEDSPHHYLLQLFGSNNLNSIFEIDKLIVDSLLDINIEKVLGNNNG